MLPAAEGGWTAVLYVSSDETEIAGWLSELQRRSPDTKIGSYPVLEHGSFHTRITIKSDERETVRQAFEEARDHFGETGALLGEVAPARNLQHEA
jgi:hypothetical protein